MLVRNARGINLLLAEVNLSNENIINKLTITYDVNLKSYQFSANDKITSPIHNTIYINIMNKSFSNIPVMKGIRNPPISVKYAMTLDLNFMLSIVDEIKNIIDKAIPIESGNTS